jgi:hypothetical protein
MTANPSCDDFERWDERELSRLHAITRLLDNPAPGPLFDNPLPEIEEEDLAVTRQHARKLPKPEAPRHG